MYKRQLYKHAAMHCGIKVDQPGTLKGIDNLDRIERVVAIDQSPIGRDVYKRQ